MPHPLVDITFRQHVPAENPNGFTGLVFERHWYHVPRPGDMLVFMEPGMLEPVTAEVALVTWHDDHTTATQRVTVWFR